MKDQDMLSGSLLIIFAIVGYAAASQLENLAVAGLSAAFYPSVLFTILLLCGLSLVYQGMKRKEKVALPVFQWGKLLPVVIALAVYVFLLEYIGFIASTMLFLLGAMYIFGERRRKILVAVPVVTSLVVYYLFSKAFMIVLP